MNNLLLLGRTERELLNCTSANEDCNAQHIARRSNNDKFFIVNGIHYPRKFMIISKR